MKTRDERTAAAVLALFVAAMVLVFYLTGCSPGEPGIELAPVPVPIPIPDPMTDPAGWVTRLYQSIAAGNLRWVVLLGVVGLVAGLRAVGARLWPWLGTDAGGALLALVGGVGTALASAAAAGRLSGAAIVNGVALGFAASGGYSTAKRFLMPLWAWLRRKLRGAPPPPPKTKLRPCGCEEVDTSPYRSPSEPSPPSIPGPGRKRSG